MFLVRAVLILCVILVCTLMVSDIGPAVFLLAFAGWGLMEWAGVFRTSGDTHRESED
jgi:hypothetical protein